MTITRIGRPTNFQSLVASHFLSRLCSFCSRSSTFVDKSNGTAKEASVDKRQNTSEKYSSKVHLFPLLTDSMCHLDGYNIELVDDDAWKVSSGLANAWRSLDNEKEGKFSIEAFDEKVDDVKPLQGDPDLDEIDNMRIRGNLFYKLDRDSKEFEEYSFDFHRREAWRKRDNNEKKETPKKNDNGKKSKQKENPCRNSAFDVEKLPMIAKDPKVYTLIGDMDSSGGFEKKKVRTPTFNQLTGPYHEPFCLDIYISKASVRACVIHRVTSKVVAVAHSISKDMKFDLASTRNAAACAAVGEILAQRALADDIHDVVYTPRKGERLEGKLQIVLQAIIDSGVNVKVKLKQRKPLKPCFPSVGLKS